MVAITLREPRPGTGGAKKADFMRPGATVTLIALAPEAGASMAVLRWANVAQSGKVLVPATMEIAALQELPLKPAAGGGTSVLDVEAARQAIRAALPPGGPTADSPVLVYWKDSLTGAGGYAAEGGEQMVETLQRSHTALKQVLEGVPTTAVGSVMSNAMSRTLGINSRNRKTHVALDTARSVFPQASDRLSSLAEHVGLANALLVAAHVIGAGVVKGEGGGGEESAATPSGTAAAEGGEELQQSMLTPSGRPKRKRAVTSYAESVSGDGSEEAVAAAGAAEVGGEAAGEGEGEGEYQPPQEKKRARAPRKRKPAAKSHPGTEAAGPAAGVAAGSTAQASPRPIMQLQQAAGVPGLTASAQPAAAAGGAQGGGGGLAAVSVAPGPELTPQQQQQLMASYLWQLQQAMLAQQVQQAQQAQGYGGGGGVGSPTAGGGLPASFPFAHALANQPVLPVVGPATGGGGYGGYGGFDYPSAYGALGGGAGLQQGGAAGSASLLGGYAGSWPQLGGAAATTAVPAAGAAAAAPNQFYAAEAGQQQAGAVPPAARAEPAGTTAQQVLAAAQQAADAQQAQRGLGIGLPGSVIDFLQ